MATTTQRSTTLHNGTDGDGMRVLIVGGSSGIGVAIAQDVIGAGGHVILSGRNPDKLDGVVAELGPRATSIHLDLENETTIARAADTLGELDHVVSLAADHANGPVSDLERGAIQRAFDTKVIGPILLAKHFAPNIRVGGSLLLFSGVAAWKPAPGLAVMATTNGAVAFLAEALAVELAPIRVNAVSPGIVDSGAWDHMGDEKQHMFDATAAKNPARRVGMPHDVSAAVMMAMTNTFVTGTVLHVDGGGRLV